uniref:Nudix hydrolase domain-containing protein n=1 Tax=viral metagenome TaxID=1070528 RepID=A0A6C0JXM6_9ZZZZ
MVKTARTLVNFPYTKSCSTSYRVILRCKTTGRYLIIRRSDSKEYLTILRGNFAVADLVRLAPKLTREEADNLRMMNTNLYTVECLRAKVVENRTQFFRKLPKIKMAVKLYSKNCPLKWAWPGGRMKSGETGKEAALRELFEEVGIRILAKTVDDTTIRDEERVCGGRYVLNYHYMAEIKDEVKPRLTFESSDAIWCESKELGNYLSEDMIRTITLPAKV